MDRSVAAAEVRFISGLLDDGNSSNSQSSNLMRENRKFLASKIVIAYINGIPMYASRSGLGRTTGAAESQMELEPT